MMARILALLLLLAAPALGADTETLQTALAAALDDPFLEGAQVGVQVVELESGKVLWSRNADTPLNPASTQKLVTTLVVLDTLGPWATLSTRVMVDGPIEEGVLKGNLYLVGGGDPELVIERWWKLALDVRSAGVLRVEGDLVLDASLFGGVGGIPGWSGGTDKAKGPAYEAPISALSINFNAVGVRVAPGSGVGDLAVATAEVPTAHVRINNSATTKEKGRTRLQVLRHIAETGVDVEVSGSIALGAKPAYFYRSIGDPLGYAGTTFAELFASLGGSIMGTTRAATAPKDGVLIASVPSRPVWALLADMNKNSSNFIAEHLLRASAASLGDGSAEGAVNLVGKVLKARGIDSQGAVWVNGSGLSREGRLTPRQLVEVIRVLAQDRQWAPEFLNSLSVTGGDGTFADRLRLKKDAGKARVKTGTLAGVLALAGVAQQPDGPDLAFALLLSGLPETWGPRRIQEAFLKTIVLGPMIDGASP